MSRFPGYVEEPITRTEDDIIRGDGDPVFRYPLNPGISEQLSSDSVGEILDSLKYHREHQPPFEGLDGFSRISGVPKSLLESIGVTSEELVACGKLRDVYSPFRMPVPLSEPRVFVDKIIGTDSTLWNVLKQELKLDALPGTKQGVFPIGLGRSTYGIIYGVRAALTKAKNILGHNVSEAVLVGDGHPLWFGLGLGGYCPVLMGSAMVVSDVQSGKVVMGLKGSYTDVPDGAGAVKAVFQGEFTIPAGITDIADSAGPNGHVANYPFNSAIANGSLRESGEESGVVPITWEYAAKQAAIARSIIEAGLPFLGTGSPIEAVYTMVEGKRAKHRSFSFAPLNEQGVHTANGQMILYNEKIGKKELQRVGFYSFEDIGASISIEGLVALAMARQKQIDEALQLGHSDNRFVRQFLPV